MNIFRSAFLNLVKYNTYCNRCSVLDSKYIHLTLKKQTKFYIVKGEYTAEKITRSFTCMYSKKGKLFFENIDFNLSRYLSCSTKIALFLIFSITQKKEKIGNEFEFYPRLS